MMHSKARRKCGSGIPAEQDINLELHGTDYLEEVGISVLCSLSCDDNERAQPMDTVVTLKQVKKLTARKRACTWPAAMLIEFIDLAMYSEIAKNKANNANSHDFQSVSDFEAETEQEHESEVDTDADCVDMEIETIESGEKSVASFL